jgi:hypothetical protein
VTSPQNYTVKNLPGTNQGRDLQRELWPVAVGIFNPKLIWWPKPLLCSSGELVWFDNRTFPLIFWCTICLFDSNLYNIAPISCTKFSQQGQDGWLVGIGRFFLQARQRRVLLLFFYRQTTAKTPCEKGDTNRVKSNALCTYGWPPFVDSSSSSTLSVSKYKMF